jgi:enoyl-[acyl-carrier protein] reductase/trans-2-enoyl-CoA reductase (NAD+)
VAFERLAHRKGLYAKSVIGDAFSKEVKEKTIALIKDDFGTIDLLVYSLAAPRRTHPKTGEVFKLALKPVGSPFASKGLDTDRKEIREVALEAATEEEIHGTVGVMGGEDWEMWVEALLQASALSVGCTTVAYSYIGPEVTWPIYRDGTIGLAKEDLEVSATKINRMLNGSGQAYVSINKGVVSQASSAIPVVSLYISVLFKAMRERGVDEGCIEQIYRLFRDHLYGASGPPQLDKKGRIRIDDFELRDDVQRATEEYWRQINSENIDEMSDFSRYKSEFLRLFGFGLSSVDYDTEVDPVVAFDYDF